MNGAFRRALVLHDIVARSKLAPVAFASATDFTLRPVRCLDRLEPQDRAIIYCFDAAAERALFTLCDDLPAMLQAPFLYEAQFNGARQIVTVPFERLDECVQAPGAQPSFVFSIGRCGSTLLSALLGSIGVPSVSEPDILTQLAEYPPHDVSPGTMALLVRACVASLSAHCGQTFVVKLRSQCSRIAVDIARAWAGAQVIFMLRAPIPWAMSRYRAFGETPDFLARLLARSIENYHHLAQAGCDPKLVWYEDLQSRPAATLAALGLLNGGCEAPLAAIMARDAQHGSHLSKCTLPAKSMGEDGRREFEAAWRAVCPTALIERYGLERLFV